MAYEIRHNPGPSAAGRTYWAELYDANKNVWDNSTNTFRDESLVTPAHRAIALSDNAGVGKYWGDLPEVPAGVDYQWFVRRQTGGAPSTISDAIELVGDVFSWDGIRVYGLADVIRANGAAMDSAAGTLPVDVRAVFGTLLTAAYVPADLLKVLGRDPNMVTNFGGINVKTISPTDPHGNTTLVAGDDYVAGSIEDGRLTYSIAPFTGTVDGVSVTWKLVSRKAYDNDDSATPELTITDGVANVTGDTLTLKIPITRAQTAGIKHLSTTPTEWKYKAICSLIGGDGETITAVLADCAVLRGGK